MPHCLHGCTRTGQASRYVFYFLIYLLLHPTSHMVGVFVVSRVRFCQCSHTSPQLLGRLRKSSYFEIVDR